MATEELPAEIENLVMASTHSTYGCLTWTKTLAGQRAFGIFHIFLLVPRA